jgi:hypothetical protein
MMDAAHPWAGAWTVDAFSARSWSAVVENGKSNTRACSDHWLRS